MLLIATSGLLILLPSAFFLAAKPAAGAFDFWLQTVLGLVVIVEEQFSEEVAEWRKCRAKLKSYQIGYRDEPHT